MATRSNFVKYTSSLILFGSNGIVAACIAAPSASIVLWRTFIGALLLLALFLGRGGRFTVFRTRKDFACMLASGISTGLSWIFLYEAYRLVGVGASSLIYYLGPIIVMALSPVLFAEKITRGKAIAFLVVLAGAMLLNGAIAGGGGNVLGLTCAAASAICHAFMVIFNKMAARVQGLENPVVQLVVSHLTVVVCIPFLHGVDLSFPVGDWIPMLFLGLVNTGVGCYLYFTSLDGLKATSVVILGYLEPLSAVVLAVLLLGETMDTAQILGAAMILGGALAAESASWRKDPSARS